MPKAIRNHRGVILFITLATLLVVVILANIILGIMNSQSRITHDQVSRIRAHGAAQAGMIRALENLRTANWTYSPVVNSCPPPDGCYIEDTSFPANIRDPLTKTARRVRIIFCPAGQPCLCQWATYGCTPPAGISFCINVTANYTPQ